MTRDRRNSTLPSVPWSSLIQLLSAGPPDPVCVSYTHDRDFGNFKELNPPGEVRQKFAPGYYKMLQEGSVVSIITQIELVCLMFIFCPRSVSRCFTCFMHVSMWGLPEGQRELSWSGLVPTPKLRISRTCSMPTRWFVERVERWFLIIWILMDFASLIQGVKSQGFWVVKRLFNPTV